MNGYELFFLGAAGACAAEMLQLYERRSTLSDNKFRRLLKSPVIWFLFVGMVSSSGFIAWAANEGSEIVRAWPVVLTGIGASALIRLTPQTVIAHSRDNEPSEAMLTSGTTTTSATETSVNDKPVLLGSSDIVLDYFG